VIGRPTGGVGPTAGPALPVIVDCPILAARHHRAKANFGHLPRSNKPSPVRGSAGERQTAADKRGRPRPDWTRSAPYGTAKNLLTEAGQHPVQVSGIVKLLAQT
jgi:hypothetical protein